MCIYIGAFVDKKELLKAAETVSKNRLQRVIDNPHVTFKFKPQSVDKTLFGETVEITIIGYANDGKNEGFKVSVTSNNPELSKMIEAIPTPHITISVAENGKPVDTGFLNFKNIHCPIKITGTFGGFTPSGVIFG